MDQNTFSVAAERARMSVATERWNCLTASERSDAIYRELRLLDAEAVRGRRRPATDRATSHFRIPESSAARAH